MKVIFANAEQTGVDMSLNLMWEI